MKKKTKKEEFEKELQKIAKKELEKYFSSISKLNGEPKYIG